MSTVKVNNVQVGQSITALNNFTLYQPGVVDGTVRIGVGNSGAVSSDVMTFTNTGNVGIGTSSPGAKLDIAGTFRIQSTNPFITLRDTDASTNCYLDYQSGSYFRLTPEGATPFIFSPNGTDRLTLDASGNLGLGVTPSAWGANYKVLQNSSGALLSFAGASLGLIQNAYDSGAGAYKYSTNAAATNYLQEAGAHKWFRSNDATPTAGNPITFTQAMTLDAGGNLSVGTTSAIAKLGVVNSGTGDTVYSYTTNASNTGAAFSVYRASTSGYSMYFNVNSNGAGSITHPTQTTTSYATSSDYRLKKDVKRITGALDRVAALKPVTYTWIVDDEPGEGFIAHELAEVCPGAVVGEKDAVNEDGSIRPQGIDTSFLVATLTAAIQEQQAMIEEMKTKLKEAGVAGF